MELRTQEQPLVAKHIEGNNRVRNDPSRNRRTDEAPFIAGCSHFTRKKTRFRAPASSPKHSPCNIHAAITMRSATTASGNAWNYAHRNNPLLQNTWKEPIASRTTPAATAAQTRYLSSPAAATLHGKNKWFRAPASSPKHSPCNIHAAITMRSATTASGNAYNYTHRNNHLLQKHIEGTNRVRNDPSRNRRTDEVPFIAGCSHFIRKNTRFRAPASSPKQSPCNIHAAITMRSATTASGNA